MSPTFNYSQDELDEIFNLGLSLPNDFSVSLTSKIPAILYHYTSVKGLLNIIQSCTLHLTDIRFLNDSNELSYGRDLVCKYLESNISTFNFASDLLNYFKNDVITSNKETIKVKYFILSFTEEKDNLTLWRTYGNNCHGANMGININFLYKKPPSLNNTTLHDDYIFSFFRVCYDKNIQKQIISDYLESVRNWNNTAPFIETNINHYFFYISSTLNLLSSCFKQSYFKDEKELRLVVRIDQHQNELIKYKEANGIVKPYIEIASITNDNVPISIKEVILGPNTNTQLLELALSDMLQSNQSVQNSFSCSIMKSDISPIII